MEFEQGHAAFYPRRPCKLDRSCSWSGTTKNTYGDMLEDYPRQYSLTDLDFNSGFYDQAMPFVDIPSMFEDALRQLASTPCFAYQADAPQAGSPLTDLNTTTPQIEPQHTFVDSMQDGTGYAESLWGNAISSGEIQDLSTPLWPVLSSDNNVMADSPLESPAGMFNMNHSIEEVHNSEIDPFVSLLSMASPDPYQAKTNLQTIEEETTSMIGAMVYQEMDQSYLESSMGLQIYTDQNLHSNPTHITENSDHVHHQIDNTMPWQSLDHPSFDESFIPSQATQASPTNEPVVVIVKVDMDALRDGQGPITPSPPLNDLMSKFDSNPGGLPPRRKRRAFTEVAKTKVRKVRVSGACVICKARKVSGSCTACIKLACRSPLADHICVRTKMGETYVGVRALHGSSFDNRKARLAPFLSSLTGEPKPIQFSVERYDDYDSVLFKNNDHYTRSLASLDIQVMQCSSSSLCRWKKLTKDSGIYITSDIFEGQRYVIVPSSLPSIDEFDRFGRKILLASNGGHSGSITLFLDRFLMTYCSRKHNTKVRDIANLTARIASLNNLVAYGFLNLRDGSYDLLEQLPPGKQNQRYVSETVHDQIRLLAAEGLEPAEKIVFNELDNMSKHFHGNEHARMIIGVSILRLMLLYRDRLVRDDIRLRLPKQKKWHQYRLEKASFMYRRLTVAYGTLCREYDTPLTMEWNDEKVIGYDEDDQTLKLLYLQLQPAFREFCTQRLTLQYDDVLKILLADPTKQQRTKKRRKTFH